MWYKEDEEIGYLNGAYNLYLDPLTKDPWPQETKKETNMGCYKNNMFDVIPSTSVTVQQLAAMQPEERTQRTYLENRLYHVKCAHEDKIRKDYFIEDPDDPKSPQEFKERIAAGQYTLDDFDADDDYWYWREHFSWRDPNKPADKVGANKAYETMEKARIETHDKIEILPLTDGLDALNAFKAMKF